MMEWLSMILTALASGGLAGFGSLWYARRRAKADVAQIEAQASQVEAQTDQVQLEVVKAVQEVYNSTIDRLQQDRDELMAHNTMLQQELDQMRMKVDRLSADVEQNSRKLSWIIPITCCVRDCQDRVLYSDGADITQVKKKKARKE